MKNKRLLIIIGLVIIVGLLVLLYINHNNYKKEMAKNDASKFANITLIYFLKNYNSLTDSGSNMVDNYVFELKEIDSNNEITICPINNKQYDRSDSKGVISIQDDEDLGIDIQVDAHLICGNYSVSYYLSANTNKYISDIIKVNK